MRQADNDLKTPIRTLTVATMLFSSSITDTFAGSFAQIDVAEDSKTLIFATKAGDWNLAAVASDWGDGELYSASAVKNVIAASEQQPFNLGLGIALSQKIYDEDGEDDSQGIGLKAVIDSYQTHDWGNSFWLAEYVTTDNNWLLMTQLLPSNTAFGLQLTAVGDDSYSGQSMALLYRLENTPWTLRTGVQHDSDDTKLFIGASYNTF